MKNLFLVYFILISVSTIAQELNYTELQGQKPKVKGPFTSYVSKSGEIYSIGDTIQLGMPTGDNGEFTYVWKWGLETLITSSYGSTGPSVTNLKIIIKEILLVGNKTSGWYAQFKTKKGNGGYFVMVENAIKVGEMKTKGMTSDDALLELKKAKDKLDLGLITQAQFDSLKSVLVKYIK